MAISKEGWVQIGAGVIITIAVGLGGWSLVETASVPKTYATKVEVDQKVTDVKRDTAEDRNRIREQLKEAVDNMVIEQRYIRDTVDELNRYLRNQPHE